jgi:hypothetical protein
MDLPQQMGIAMHPPWTGAIPIVVAVSRTWIQIQIAMIRRLVCIWTNSRVKIICIRFKAGRKVRDTFVPPTTEPRNPKKYSSTIGYGALLATGGENGGGGGLDGHGFGMTSYVTVGGGDASSGKETGRGKGKAKEKKQGSEKSDKCGPYLRKTSLPSLGIT